MKRGCKGHSQKHVLKDIWCILLYAHSVLYNVCVYNVIIMHDYEHIVRQIINNTCINNHKPLAIIIILNTIQSRDKTYKTMYHQYSNTYMYTYNNKSS